MIYVGSTGSVKSKRAFRSWFIRQMLRLRLYLGASFGWTGGTGFSWRDAFSARVEADGTRKELSSVKFFPSLHPQRFLVGARYRFPAFEHLECLSNLQKLQTCSSDCDANFCGRPISHAISRLRAVDLRCAASFKGLEFVVVWPSASGSRTLSRK